MQTCLTGENTGMALHIPANAAAMTLLSSSRFLMIFINSKLKPLSRRLVREFATSRPNTRTHWQAAYRTPTRGCFMHFDMQDNTVESAETRRRDVLSKSVRVAKPVNTA